MAILLFRTKKDEDGGFEGRVLSIDVGAIRPNRAQPRRAFDDAALQALAASIREHGILQPLTVRRAPEGDDAFELIAGERRLRAAVMAGLTEVPCLLFEADARRSAELAIVENLQRRDLSFFEEAAAIASLIDVYRLTQEQIARRLSVSQSYVANKLRLLRLSNEDRAVIESGGLTERHARAALRLPGGAERTDALKYIVSRNMNVAAAESYIENRLAERAREAHRAHRATGVIKDIRIFYNSVDRAIDIMRHSGIEASRDVRRVEDGIELIIRIPHATEAREKEPAAT